MSNIWKLVTIAQCSSFIWGYNSFSYKFWLLWNAKYKYILFAGNTPRLFVLLPGLQVWRIWKEKYKFIFGSGLTSI